MTRPIEIHLFSRGIRICGHVAGRADPRLLTIGNARVQRGRRYQDNSRQSGERHVCAINSGALPGVTVNSRLLLELP